MLAIVNTEEFIMTFVNVWQAFTLASVIMSFTCVYTNAFTQTEIDAYRASALADHNSFRALYGAPNLAPSSSLNADAQDWADHLGAICQMQHQDASLRNGAGENLYMHAWSSGTATIADADGATQGWHDEYHYYNYCYNDDAAEITKRPGYEGEMVGHFTQLVWNSTTDLGIGVASGSGSCPSHTYVVARYSPAGNIGSSSHSYYQDNVGKSQAVIDYYQDDCDATAQIGSTVLSNTCSASCGGGFLYYTTTCSGKPSWNGADCVPGNILSTVACNTEECIIITDRKALCEERSKDFDETVILYAAAWWNANQGKDWNDCDLICKDTATGYYWKYGNLGINGMKCTSDSTNPVDWSTKTCNAAGVCA